tara:strand:- start:913 stop:1080 length:168 start_codon:yes stop_codon:yes gene_type:complete
MKGTSRELLYKRMILEIVISYSPDDIEVQIEILKSLSEDLQIAWDDEVKKNTNNE